MIHPTMFLTSHLRMMGTSNQTKFQYISVPYGHVIVPLHVPLRIFQTVYLQELDAPHSYNCPFQLVYFVILLLLMIS